MLKLILGIAGTGKTTRLLELMDERAQNKKKSIFLVPEQFSSSAEMMVYKAFGDAKSGLIEVVSFRTMAERILKQSGGANVPVLTEAARTVFVRRILDDLADELHSFARQKRNHAFCSMCASTIEELKTAGATPAVLQQIGFTSKEPKIMELALLFEAYEAMIAGSAMDPVDKLTLAAEKAKNGYFVDKACFIDNFDGFTTPEYTLLASVLAECEQVTIGMCCDSLTENEGGLGLFSPVRKTAQKLMRIQQAFDGRVQQEMLVRQYRSENVGPAKVNELLAFGEMVRENDDHDAKGLTVTQYESDWQEARTVAAAMHDFALQGVAYSKMAVVCRDVALYETVMKRAFHLFDIPYFVDTAATIEYTSVVVFLRAALRILREGFSSEAILSLLKTGLCGFAAEELAALENYVYTWRPKAADWRTTFDKNPEGLMQSFGAEQKYQLALAEKVRAFVVPRLKKFMDKTRGENASVLSKELYLLLKTFKAEENAQVLENTLSEWENPAAAEDLRRTWDLTMDLLEQMDLLVGEETLSASEYDDLFLLMVRSTEFGRVPQSLECAIFTSADRMRLADPEICFVLGVAEGEFPMQVGYSGLLTHIDRDLLVSGGIEMPGSFENRTLLEEMFFYRALTSAKKELHVSWPLRHAGKAQSVSVALQPICEELLPKKLFVDIAKKAATPAAAFDLLGKIYRENSPQAAAIEKALEYSPEKETRSWLSLLKQVQLTSGFKVENTALIPPIVGETLTLTATKTERYYQCHFSYYMERILNVKARRRAELSPMESGTFVHYILQHVLQETGAEFSSLPDDELRELSNKFADDFIQENLAMVSLREKTILENVKSTVVDLLLFLRDSAAESDFVLDAIELPIGDEEDGVVPLEVETAQGHKLRVTGKVDRIDVLRQGTQTYLSIIDYKTGSKEFKLADVYCGLNTQMMIYMYTLRNNAQNRYPNAKPAAVLYVGADPSPATGTRTEIKQTFKIDGLLLDDPDILHALDHTPQALFLPVTYDKKGKPRASKKLASLAKIGEIEKRVEMLLCEMANGVYNGEFAAEPLVETSSKPCDYCAYRVVCRHEDGVHEKKVEAPKNVFEPVKEGHDGE